MAHLNRRASHTRRQQSVDFPRYPPLSQSQTPQPPPVPAPTPAMAPPPMPALPLQISDYESDNPGYHSDYPSKPPPPNRTNEELNLSVLKRHNSEINSILSIAPYAVVYEFSPLPQPEWTKTGVEGSLFICELTPGLYGEDRYSAIILNRRGLDNFEAELREGENAGVEITGEYVIISFKEAHEQKIYGVYIFHDRPGTSTENAMQLNGDLMKSLADHAGASRQAAQAAASAVAAQHTNGHIQEAGQTLLNQQANAPSAGQQISLQQLFGQQRANDAAFSVKAHDSDGQVHQQSQSVRQQQQSDVLGDLFRRAGLGAR